MFNFRVVTVLLVLSLWVPTASSAAELDLTGISSVIVRSPNNPLAVTTGFGPFSASAPLGCDTGISSTVQGAGIILDVVGTDQDCLVTFVLPITALIRIESGNGDLAYSGPAATLQIDIANGLVFVSDVGATPTSIRTANGDITLLRAAGSVNVDSSNGKINLQDIQGEFKITASNAYVTLKNIVLPVNSRNSIKTVNADVKVSGLRTAKLEDGKARAGLQVSARSTTGNIRIKANGQSMRGGNYTRDGRSKARLSIRTVTGNVSVRVN